MDRDKPFNDLPLLPPDIDLNAPEILKRAITANRHLAELKGSVLSMPNQNILINSIVLQESRLSTEIENIVTTTDDLYRSAFDEKNAQDLSTKEVLHYRKALWHGIEFLKERPLSTNLFIEIASIIKQMDMNVRKVPGTKIASNEGVIYTPPEGESVILDKLSNLESFIHAEDEIDHLIKLAIIHYQFEAIHPFIDGNGRTGRIINILFLVEKQLLDHPVLYLSHYILETKQEYYHCLRNITENNDWHSWIVYILKGIEITAIETMSRVNSILDAIESAKLVVKERVPKIYSTDLIETIFMHPYSKVSFLVDAGIAKRQTAAVYLKQLEEVGLLKSEKAGREQYYINTKLIDILSN